MTSSLVGSEMCIRDRCCRSCSCLRCGADPLPGALSWAGRGFAVHAAGSHAALRSDLLRFVSYNVT
eukprot:12254687-Prorocentrum_lima.AAC.1